MNSTTKSSRRLLFYTLCLAYVATGILVILPGPTLPLLAAHTRVPLDIAGWIFTASSLGFTLSVIIAGSLSGRFRAKYILMSGLGITGLVTLITPWTHLYGVLLVSQFILGIGFGFIDVSINVIVTLAFEDVLGETLNNLHSSFGVGALIGPLLLSLALQVLHESTWAFLVGTVIALTTTILLLRQHVPAISKQSAAQQRTSPISRPVSPGVLTQVVLWLMALQMFLYVAAEVGFGDWITTAVSQSAVVTLAAAAPAAAMFWLGLTIGRLLGAQALRREILSENALLYLCFIGGGLAGLLVAVFPGVIWLSFGASLMAGLFFGPIFPGVMAIASRRFMHVLGMVSSVMLFSAGASGLILPVLVGFLITRFGVGWGMVVPALICLLIAVPFYLAQRRHTLQLDGDVHTMESEAPLPITK